MASTGLVIAGALGAIGTAVKKSGALIDIARQPDSIRYSGNNLTASALGALSLYMRVYRVKDYEKVAMILERTGYRVDQVTTDTNITLQSFYDTYLNNRYYYNPFQLVGGSIAIDSMLAPSGVIEDIQRRLANGVRVWDNINADGNFIGNYKYDNVEKDFI